MAKQTRMTRRDLLKTTAALAATPAIAYAAAVIDPLIQPEVARAAGTDSLSNSSLEIIIDTTTGAILDIVNLHSGTHLTIGSVQAKPWQIQQNLDDFETSWYPRVTPSFSYTKTSDTLTLTWVDATEGYTVTGTIKLPAGTADLTISVQVSGSSQVALVEYPSIVGVQKLSTTTDDYLAHPFATGYLFQNPSSTFTTTMSSKAGVVLGIYTDGYNGPPMQWMAYYIDGGDGFYFGTNDPGDNVKWLDFFKYYDGPPGLLETRFRHASPDVHAGNGFTMSYQVIIGALIQGTWYEAADKYRAWAITQSWAKKGPLVGRADTSTWLLDTTGYATVGINAPYDRSQWINDLHSAIPTTTAYHILSPNWQQYGSDYLNHANLGRDGFFPARVNTATLAAITSNHDHVTAFSFPLLFDLASDGADRLDAASSYQALPLYTVSRDGYAFHWLCPVPALATDMENYRISQIINSPVGFDAAYYDIACSNSLKICESASHGHKIGGGPELISAYRSLMAQAKAVATAAKGVYVPQGTEMIIENFIAELDFYQTRGEACPMAGFESADFRDWIKSGLCEKIPAFEYVYHDYGPVRLDGWGSLASDDKQGIMFYWVAARVVLWGGIFELNYELGSLPTNSAGADDDTSQDAYPYSIDRPYANDSNKGLFISKLAGARTGWAQAYLVYGQMLRPVLPDVTPPTIDLNYFFYDYFIDFPEYQDSGVLTVSSVVASAYSYTPAGASAPTKAGLLYVNLQDPVTFPSGQNVSLSLTPANYGLGSAMSRNVYLVTAAGSTLLGSISAGGSRTFPSVNLPARDVIMLEIR